MKKLIGFISLFIVILLGVNLIDKDNYISYIEFYKKVNNKEIDTIFYNNSDKIKFKEKNNDTVFITDNPRTENFKQEMLINGIDFKEQLNIGNSLTAILTIILISSLIFVIYKKNKKILYL